MCTVLQKVDSQPGLMSTAMGAVPYLASSLCFHFRASLLYMNEQRFQVKTGNLFTFGMYFYKTQCVLAGQEKQKEIQGKGFPSWFQGLVTDLTAEGWLSGVKVLWKIKIEPLLALIIATDPSPMPCTGAKGPEGSLCLLPCCTPYRAFHFC